MLSQSLANPDIFTIVRANQQYQIIPSSVVSVKEVRDDAQEAQPTRDDDEFIFLSQFLEYILLEFLPLLVSCGARGHGDLQEEGKASRGLSHRWASV